MHATTGASPDGAGVALSPACHNRATEMARDILGRHEELTCLRAFVDGAAGGPAALVLEGEAGIGKSTLWLAAVEHARAGGARVLLARPAEAERGLGHAGLGDLFDGVVDDVLPTLSTPRRRALEVALLRQEASGDPIDGRTLAVAVRDALAALGERGTTVVAIDDVQWLDPSTSHALAFALRRLDTVPVIVLLARRVGDELEPSDVEQALAVERLQRVVVGPLSVGALHQLLRDRLGLSFPRQTLLRIHERSGGNPFFALEVAGVMSGDVGPLEQVPVPGTVEELLRERISTLPASTQEALGLASAVGAPAEALLLKAGVTPGSLDDAVAARVVERDDGTIRFTHPLLAAALYNNLGARRRRVHARIAEVVDDPIARARHLALAAEAPDSGVARLLDGAAALEAERGGSALAAELAEHAFLLTPPDERDERLRRALAAGRAELAAGEWTRARTIATDLLAEVEEGPIRAEALVLLSEFEHDDLAVPVLEEALRHAGSDVRLEARVQIKLALAQRFRNGFDGALVAGRTALELADRVGDDPLRFEALLVVNMLGSMVGDVETPAYAERAQAIAVASADPLMLRDVSFLAFGATETFLTTEASRAKLERTYQEWQGRDELFAASVLTMLSWTELRAGRWALAADYAARSHETNLQYGVERNQDYIPISWIAAHRGDLALAQSASARGLMLCDEQIGFHPPLLKAVPGLCALWSGDAESAVQHLAEADQAAQKLGWGSADARPWTSEYAEALLQVERIEEADSLVDRWEDDGERLRSEIVLAHVLRCRGLVAAARGALDDAVSLLERAVARHDEHRDAFGRARALLALGVVLRRARQKRAAQDAIARAVTGFEELGAAGWLETARNELGKIGGRRREDGLTTAERRVATLVAAGKTNREVAAQLFLAERTVAGHLTRVYAKLGVRSRTELARRLG